MTPFLLDFFFGELLSLLLHLRIHLIQIIVQILEHHIQFLRNQQHLLQLYDAGMVQFSKRFYLPQLDALVPVRIFLLHLLDSHHLARLDVGRLVNRPKSTVPQGLYRLILLHD